jgi:hypothetical protein
MTPQTGQFGESGFKPNPALGDDGGCRQAVFLELTVPMR